MKCALRLVPEAITHDVPPGALSEHARSRLHIHGNVGKFEAPAIDRPAADIRCHRRPSPELKNSVLAASEKGATKPTKRNAARRSDPHTDHYPEVYRNLTEV